MYGHQPESEESEYTFPSEEWRFLTNRVPTQYTDSYHGGALDSVKLGTTPFLDISRHDPLVAFAGGLPPTFKIFLNEIGHSSGKTAAIQQRVRTTLVRYLKKAWVTYCTLQANTTLATQPSTRTSVPAISATLMVNDRDYIVVTLTLKKPAPTGTPHPPAKHTTHTPNWPSKPLPCAALGYRGEPCRRDAEPGGIFCAKDQFLAERASRRFSSGEPSPPIKVLSVPERARHRNDEGMTSDETQPPPVVAVRWRIPITAGRTNADYAIRALHPDAPFNAWLTDDEIPATVQALSGAPIGNCVHPYTTAAGLRPHHTFLEHLNTLGEEVMREGVISGRGTVGKRLLAGLPFNLVSGTGMHWISVAFWPRHHTVYLYDPLNTFPPTLRTALRESLPTQWIIHDLNIRTQRDTFECGVHSILFSHLVLALTSDGEQQVRQLEPDILASRRLFSRTDCPVNLRDVLRAYLLGLLPSAMQRLRACYTALLRTVHPDIYPDIPGNYPADPEYSERGRGLQNDPITFPDETDSPARSVQSTKLVIPVQQSVSCTLPGCMLQPSSSDLSVSSANPFSPARISLSTNPLLSQHHAPSALPAQPDSYARPDDPFPSARLLQSASSLPPPLQHALPALPAQPDPPDPPDPPACHALPDLP